MRWKWILGISLAVIVALIVTAYIVVASYDFNKFKPLVMDLAVQYTGRDLTIEGDIELGLSLFPTLVVNDVAFQNASWGTRPQMARFKRLEVQVAVIPILRGNIHVSRLTVMNPEILVEKNKSGQSNLEFDVPQTVEPQAVEDNSIAGTPEFLKLKKMEILDGAVTYNDQQSGRTETILIENLKFETDEFGAPLDVDFQFSYKKIPFQITGSLGQLSGILNPAEQWPLNLTITAVGSTVSIAGHITNLMEVKGIDLKLAARGKDAANFEEFTGKHLPFGGPFEVAGHLAAPALEEMKISDIAILLAESKISGEIAVIQKSPGPRIDAKFSSRKLNLRPFIKKDYGTGNAETKPTKSKAKRRDKVFSDEPFDLQALQQIDATVNFQADHILTHRTALDNFKIEITLKNGRFIVNPITADIGGGNVNGSLELHEEGNKANLSAKLTANKIDIGDMLKKLEITRDLEGVLDVKIDLNGRGTSVATMMAGLNGDMVAVLSKGYMPIEYINLVAADITTSLLKIINPFEKKIDRAQINCAVCDFNIKDGLAKSDVIMIDDPDKTLLSTGTVNLKTEELDFGIHTKPKEGLGTGKTGKVSVSLSAVTRPFKLGGTLANPSLGISPQRAAKTVGSALLVPGGLAALFVTHSSGEENPCAEALKIAGEGARKTQSKSVNEKEIKGTSDKKEEGVGSKIKKIFSKPKD